MLLASLEDRARRGYRLIQRRLGVRGVDGRPADANGSEGVEQQLRYVVEHDSLTGLYTRAHFVAELEGVLRRARGERRAGALLIFDVDNFKLINDAHGNAAGDGVLKALALAVAQRAHTGGVVARLGGDEIALVLAQCDEQRASAVAEEIRADVAASELERPFHLSVGIACFDGSHEPSADDVLVAADVALYEAKEGGKNQVRVYRGDAGGAATWAQRIRDALAEERFVLYAQPIVELASGETLCKELLIRMLSDSGEPIAPGAFLPTAERLGLIGEIDHWVVREGLRLAAGGERVSINLSAQSIGDAAILAELRAAIAAGLEPADVLFEITETAAMANMAQASAFAQTLGELGCDVALDDFGTGFGSFTYLKHLPARYLKIDMEFVRDLAFNDTDQQLVSSIAKVARSLGKRTVAEGVEDRVTLQALRDRGVDCAQGYFLGRPRRISPPTRFEREPRGAQAAI